MEHPRIMRSGGTDIHHLKPRGGFSVPCPKALADVGAGPAGKTRINRRAVILTATDPGVDAPCTNYLSVLICI